MKSFRKLKVYPRARLEARCVFDLTKQFPVEERYSLTNQICRSSRAVGAIQVEAWARRYFEAVFVNKVNEAAGEACETRAWPELDCGYRADDTHKKLDAARDEVATMLHAMGDEPALFCGK